MVLRILFFYCYRYNTDFTHIEILQNLCKYGQFKAKCTATLYRHLSFRASAFTIDDFSPNITSE